MPLEKIISANPEIANPNELTIGMKVKIPSQPVVTQPGNSILHSHTVVQGDSLWKLSKAWGVPLQDMIATNPQLKNPNVLLVGEVVYIPSGSPGNAQGGSVQSGQTNSGMSPKTTVGSEQYTGVKEQQAAPIEVLPNYPQLPQLPTMPEAPVIPKAEITKPMPTPPKAEQTKPLPTPPKVEVTKPKPVPPKAEITKPIAPAPKPEMTNPLPPAPKQEVKPIAPPPKPLPLPAKQPEMVKPMPLPAPVKKPEYDYCDPCYPAPGMIMPYYEDKHQGHAGHWPGFHKPYGHHGAGPMGHHGYQEAVPYGQPMVQGAYDQMDGTYTTYEHGGYMVDYALVHGNQYGDCGCGQTAALPYSYAQAESDWKAATAQNEQPYPQPQAYGHQPQYTNYYRPNEYGVQTPYVDTYYNPYSNYNPEQAGAEINSVDTVSAGSNTQADIDFNSLAQLPKIEEVKPAPKNKAVTGKNKAKKAAVSSTAQKRSSANRAQGQKKTGLSKTRKNPWIKR